MTIVNALRIDGVCVLQNIINFKLRLMKSGIKDKNGKEVKIGDWIAIPYIDPMGRLTEDEDYRVEVKFKYGCFGYYNELKFVPLLEWQSTDRGDYIPNAGNIVIYTEEYPFWVVTE